MRQYTTLQSDYVVPASSYILYPEGEHCTNAEPGDIILVKHNSITSKIIRFGQKHYYWRKRLFGKKEYLKEYCRFNHTAIIVNGGNDAQLVEMASKGGQQVSLLTYQAKEYAVIKLEADEAQKKDAVDFANYCLNIEYGYFAIFAIAMNILVGLSIIVITRSLICSAATSLSARCMGLIPDGPDSTIMPADHARYFDVRKP